jgi:hypothetical protein
MRTRIVMEDWYYTVCQHSTPFVLNGPAHLLVFRNILLTLLWSLLLWIPPSTFLSSPRKRTPSAFWQATFV